MSLSSPNPASPYGVGIPYGDLRRPTSDSALNYAQAMNVGYARVGIYWADLQPAGPGPLDPTAIATVRNIVQRLTSRNLIPVLAVSGAPDWALDNPADTTKNNYEAGPGASKMEAWRDFFQLLVNDPDLAVVQYWAVGNEPNVTLFVQSADRLSIYKSMVQYAAGPIHAAGDKLLGPELIGGWDPTTQLSGGAWFSSVLEEVGSLIDFVTVHSYHENSSEIENDMLDFSNRMANYGSTTNKALWLTEAATAYAHPPSWQQRVHLTETLYRMSDRQADGTNPRWKKTFWWSLTSEYENSPAEGHYDWRGLLSGAGDPAVKTGPVAPKQAYYCLQALATYGRWGYIPSYCMDQYAYPGKP